MKKIVLAMTAAMLMSVGAMAQDAQKSGEGRPNKAEMVQKRTEETAKKYGLNDDQKTKLLELNTKYADKMGPQRGGQRQGFRGERPQRRGIDSLKARPVEIKGDTLKREGRRGRPQGNNGQQLNREEGRKVFEAYDAELKEILTTEQYEAYKNDQKKQFEGQRRNGPRNGQRPHRDN